MAAIQPIGGVRLDDGRRRGFEFSPTFYQSCAGPSRMRRPNRPLPGDEQERVVLRVSKLPYLAAVHQWIDHRELREALRLVELYSAFYDEARQLAQSSAV
jgi:hypothetical protein